MTPASDIIARGESFRALHQRSAAFIIPRAELSDLGVRRVSVGSSLSRSALSAFVRAATELKNEGSFSYAKNALSVSDFTEMFRHAKT